MSTNRIQVRMKKELSMLQHEPPPGMSCWCINEKVTELHASIIGSEGSPFEKGTFKLKIVLPDRYPFEPPVIKFVTPIYHPNIDSSGRICLDLLKMPPKGSWKPSLNISVLLKSIQILMSNPNPNDPLMLDIANEFRSNKLAFLEKAKSWTKKHACDEICIKESVTATRPSNNVGACSLFKNSSNKQSSSDVDACLLTKIGTNKRSSDDVDACSPTKISTNKRSSDDVYACSPTKNGANKRSSNYVDTYPPAKMRVLKDVNQSSDESLY